MNISDEQVELMKDAVEACDKFFRVAMPNMNIADSPLDAESIYVWNQAAVAVHQAMKALSKEEEMRTQPHMSDEELKKTWASIHTLEVAIEEALKYQNIAACCDPYYRDLTDAIWNMIKRCHEIRKDEQKQLL